MSGTASNSVLPAPSVGSWGSLLRSFGNLAVGEVLGRIFGALAVIWAARHLGPSDFGLVMLGLTLVGWFALLVDSGTEMQNIRDVARDPGRFARAVPAILGLRLALTAATVPVFLVVALLVASGSDRRVLGLFALVLPAMALNLRWMVIGLGRAKAVAIGNAASQALLLVGVIVLVRSKGDAEAMPILQAGGELLYAVVVVSALAGGIRILRPKFDLSAWREILKGSLPLLATSLARATIYSVNIVLIAVMLSRSDIGVFGAAYKPVFFASGGVGLFLISFLASYSAAETTVAAEVLRRAFLAAVLVTIPLAVVTTLAAHPIVRLLYGPDYESAAGVLAIVIWFVPLMALGGILGFVLIAVHREAALMRNNIVGAAASIAAGAIAIRYFGLQGAALATVFSQLIVLFLNARSVGPSILAARTA